MKTFIGILFCLILLGSKQTIEVPIIENDLVLLNREERISQHKAIIDSINQELNWTKTSYDLWKSNMGDLAIQSEEANENNIGFKVYITNVWSEKDENLKIKEVIDTLSFKFLGSSFYKDKNSVYRHYVMSDGGNFAIVEDADPSTFRIIGDCYAKDKNYIFGERAMQLDSVDYATFKTEKGLGCYAKDMFGYYLWDERFDIEELNKLATKDLYIRLKNL